MEKKGSSIPKQFGNKNVRLILNPHTNLLQILDKKVPKNPKYDKVKSTVDTGKTMKDVEIISMKLL